MAKNKNKHGGYAGSGEDLAQSYLLPMSKPRLECTDSHVIGSVSGEYTVGGVVGGLHAKKDHSGLKAGSGKRAR